MEAQNYLICERKEERESMVELFPDPQNLAAFIASRSEDSECRILISEEDFYLTTKGTLITSCQKLSFFQTKLLPELFPMQLGEREIPEIKEVERLLDDEIHEREME